MPRIAKSDVHQALMRAAQNIADAQRPDGIVSREDMRRKLEELSGTEKKLTEIFYRFIDHRDNVPGARITQSDIDKAVAYAKERMIDKYDLNNNGLSKDEIASMSLTGQLAVELARELKAAGAVTGGGGLDAAALEQKMVDFVKANTGDGYDTLFPELNSGNNGLYAYVLDAGQGDLMVQTLKACKFNPSLPEIQELSAFEFDPARHAVFGVLATWDEPELHVVIADRQTGECRRLGVDMNFFNVVDTSELARLLPEAMDGDDYMDSFKAMHQLLKDGKEINLSGDDSGWNISYFG